MSAGTEVQRRRPDQPLHPPPRPRRRRTGTELARSDPAQGPRRQVRRRPLLLRRRPRGRGDPLGHRRAGQPELPAASRIGSVTVGAGPGTNPFYAHGTAYLAGPYKGAPMSVAVITPAVAGPFDLGTVVGQKRPLRQPRNRPGPRRLRSAARRSSTACRCGCARSTSSLDRPNFTLNPTNCIAAGGRRHPPQHRRRQLPAPPTTSRLGLQSPRLQTRPEALPQGRAPSAPATRP